MIGSNIRIFSEKIIGPYFSHLNEKEGTMKFLKGNLFIIIIFLVVLFLLLVVTDKIKIL